MENLDYLEYKEVTLYCQRAGCGHAEVTRVDQLADLPYCRQCGKPLVDVAKLKMQLGAIRQAENCILSLLADQQQS